MKVQNTKASAMSKRTLTLVLAMAVFLLSALILRVSLTNGFSVDVKTVNFVTDESVNMGGTLWVPSNATAETPAAGIVVAPGGNTPMPSTQATALSLQDAAMLSLHTTITEPWDPV